MHPGPWGLALRVDGDGLGQAEAILQELLAWHAEAPAAGSAWTPDTDSNERLRGNPPGSLLEIQHPPWASCIAV